MKARLKIILNFVDVYVIISQLYSWISNEIFEIVHECTRQSKIYDESNNKCKRDANFINL